MSKNIAATTVDGLNFPILTAMLLLRIIELCHSFLYKKLNFFIKCEHVERNALD